MCSVHIWQRYLDSILITSIIPDDLFLNLHVRTCIYSIVYVPSPHVGKMVQSLYDSLELKDSEIYCKRAKELYSSAEPLRTGLFVFSMKDTRLLAMFDPTMLGEENLINNLKDIDKIRYGCTLCT